MNNDRENDSFRTSTDIYGGIDTDYDTQFVPYNGEDEVYEVIGGRSRSVPRRKITCRKKEKKEKAKKKTLYAQAGSDHSSTGRRFSHTSFSAV
mgnify:CR=1 FL=1